MITAKEAKSHFRDPEFEQILESIEHEIKSVYEHSTNIFKYVKRIKYQQIVEHLKNLGYTVDLYTNVHSDPSVEIRISWNI